MRFACPLVFVAVLLGSTAVSSKNVRVPGESNCKWSSTNLCNNLSNQDDLDGNPRADDVKKEVDAIVLQPDQLSCSTCNSLSLILKEKFESIKREDMAERMLHSCYSLQVLSETCANIVTDYFDDIYDLVKEQLQSNDICAVSGICSDGDLKMESDELQYARKHDEFYCVECKKIVKHVHESLIKTLTEAQFKKMMMGSCTLTRNFKAECRRVVDQYSHIIYNTLINDLNTEGVCLLIGVCHDKRKEDMDLSNELQLSLENDNDKFELEMPQPVIEEYSKVHPKCNICKASLNAVKQMLKHGDKDEIKKALSQVCHKIGKLHHICEEMVNKHSDQIVDLLLKHAPTDKICKMIGMCRKSASQEAFEIDDELSEEQNNQIANVETMTASPECLIFEVDELLPEEVFADSKTIFEFWDVLVSDENYVNYQLEEPTDPKEGPLCLICELLIARLKATVDTKAKRDKIVHNILYTCDDLPNFIRQPCHSIVQGYGYAILDLISKVTPHEVCLILQTSDYETSSDDVSF
ncbi:hypothetical protein ACLKA7_013611 [Drosophila subpalustris]